MKTIAANLVKGLANLGERFPKELSSEIGPMLAGQKAAQGALLAAQGVLSGYQGVVTGTMGAARWIADNGLGGAFDVNAASGCGCPEPPPTDGAGLPGIAVRPHRPEDRTSMLRTLLRRGGLLFLLPSSLTAQEASGYGPADATSFLQLDVPRLGRSFFGAALRGSKLGPQIAPLLDGSGVATIELASVGRTGAETQLTWLAHLRGKALRLPALDRMAIDLASPDAMKWKQPSILRYRQLGPDSLLLGYGAHLVKTGGQPVAGAPAATADPQPWVAKVTARMSNPYAPRAPQPLLGIWNFPLLSGVRYAKDPVRSVTAVIRPTAKGAGLTMEAEIGFVHGTSVEGLIEALQERVARAMHSGTHVALRPFLRTIQVSGSPSQRQVTIQAAIPDRVAAEAVVAACNDEIRAVFVLLGLSQLQIMSAHHQANPGQEVMQMEGPAWEEAEIFEEAKPRKSGEKKAKPKKKRTKK